MQKKRMCGLQRAACRASGEQEYSAPVAQKPRSPLCSALRVVHSSSRRDQQVEIPRGLLIRSLVYWMRKTLHDADKPSQAKLIQIK